MDSNLQFGLSFERKNILHADNHWDSVIGPQREQAGLLGVGRVRFFLR